MSEYKIIKNNSENLIICFGGIKSKMGGILPFEFLNYLSKTYKKNIDQYFYIDKNRSLYHKGIEGISKNIDETVLYLNNIIKNKSYKKILFMGVSGGGYASILFGSLCNVSNVMAFKPPTKLDNKLIQSRVTLDKRYVDLKTIINNKTKYILHGDTKVKNKNSSHHISQCNYLDCFQNVKIIYYKGLNMRVLRNNGIIKKNIDNILINHL